MMNPHVIHLSNEKGQQEEFPEKDEGTEKYLVPTYEQTLASSPWVLRTLTPIKSWLDPLSYKVLGKVQGLSEVLICG